MTHLSVFTIVCAFLQRQSNPCPHILLTRHPPGLSSAQRVHYMPVRLVTSIDQVNAAEARVSRAPPTTVSDIDHPCGATATCVSCVGQDSVSAADCNSVSEASFLGKQALASWPILLGTVDVSEAFNCCASDDSACFRNHHQRLPTYVPAPAGASVKSSTTVFSCTCFEACSSYNPDESGGDPGRRGHQNCPRRRQKRSPRRSQNTETVIRSWHLVRAPSPVGGEVGFCEVLDTWRVARPPRCQHASWNAVLRVPFLQENLTSTLSNIF